MKKIAIIGLLTACAAGVQAQGTLQFFNNYPDLQFQIYAPNPASPGVQQTGDTAAQGAASDVTGPFTTYGGIPIGGSTGAAGTPINYTFGNNFTAQIYASPAGNGQGAVPTFSSLSPVSQYIENFNTTGGAANAYLAEATLTTDAGIPGTGYSGTGKGAASILNNANVAVAAWYNAGGTINSLAAAQAAGVPSGVSQVAIISSLGEPASVETAANSGHAAPGTTPPEPYGLESFSLVTATPEPSTIALGLMGACAFLARRRKK